MEPADPNRSGEAAISRREVLRRAAIAAAAAAALPSVLADRAAAGGGPYESFTDTEAQTVEAIVERFVPTDASGPGAREAQVARYIDRALAGDLSHHRRAYAAGLAAVDALAQALHAGRFSSLSPERQDDVLRRMEANRANGFSPDSRTFFDLVLAHTYQGLLCDPYYGGNAGFVGWDLIGYPGVKIDGVTPAEQALGTAVRPVHRSAYDYPLFRKP